MKIGMPLCSVATDLLVTGAALAADDNTITIGMTVSQTGVVFETLIRAGAGPPIG